MGVKTCDICGKDTKRTQRAKDGILCDECYVAAGFPAAISVTIIPISVLKDQIHSSDGKSIIKRFKEGGGVTPESKPLPASPPTPKCARCGSASLSADKKGFGIGKGVIGAAIAGPIGLMAGNAGAKKVRITCLNCGHQWMAGKG